MPCAMRPTSRCGTEMSREQGAPMTAVGTTVDVTARIDKLRAILAARELDAAVSQSPATIAYLTGFQALLYSRPIYLIVTPERSELVVPGLEEEHVDQAQVTDRVTV